MHGPDRASGYLGVDVGTTHCKAAVYSADGRRASFASRPTLTRRDPAGRPFFDPDDLWTTIASLIRESMTDRPVVAVGVAGMAEAGLLVDRVSGRPRSEIIPWYDPRSSRQAEELTELESPRTGYQRSGLYPSFKYGVTKILWLRERDPDILDGAMWLSVPDYIVFRLTGHPATDPTLAARTYAYDIQLQRWDSDWIARLSLSVDLFPVVLPSGCPAGSVTSQAAVETGLALGTAAAVGGHDHLCALVGAGITHAGPVLDSMGTAESLLGVSDCFPNDAFESGLTIVPHVLPNRFCWLGGLPASGGSIEWARRQLGDPPISYAELLRLAADAGPDPTGITFFPYLMGSGAPWHDQSVRAALIGLGAEHGRGHFVRAILEGTALETLAIEEAAAELTRSKLTDVVTVGGGTRNASWLQIKADVSGRRHVVPQDVESVVRGAAFTAALGAGSMLLEDLPPLGRVESIEPDPGRHARYRTQYEDTYLRLQRPLRDRAAGFAQGSVAHA